MRLQGSRANVRQLSDTYMFVTKEFKGVIVFRCKFCRWYSGSYGGYDYVLDPVSGWWEEDHWRCYCFCRDHCGRRLFQGSSFFARGSLSMHHCDTLLEHGLRDDEDDFWPYDHVITCARFLPLVRGGLPSWRERVRVRNTHFLGKFLSMKAWTRLRLCTDSTWREAIVISPPGFHMIWLPVVLEYTRSRQWTYQRAYVDAISYLPLGTLVLPAMSREPSDVDPAGWLWAKFRTLGATTSRFG